jgi:arylsulfatase A-like enzyme
MHWPQQFQKDLRCEALVELVDIVPTLLEACGVPLEPAIQGQSLLPILTGRQDPASHRDHVYCEYYNAWTHRHAYGTMMRTENKKIIVYHGIDAGELYDLTNDPDEFENLWPAADELPLREQLLKKAFDASVFTMDPLPPRLGPF